MDEDNIADVETRDFIPVSGSSSSFESSRGYSGNQRFGGNRGGYGGGGRNRFRGRSYHNQPYPNPNQAYQGQERNFMGNYQSRGGRGNFRPYPGHQQQHRGRRGGGGGNRGGDDISLFIWKAMENPWSKLEAARASSITPASDSPSVDQSIDREMSTTAGGDDNFQRPPRTNRSTV